MKTIHFSPKGVCARAIDIELENDVIHSVRFQGGCAGNTQGVAALVKGMSAKEAWAWDLTEAYRMREYDAMATVMIMSMLSPMPTRTVRQDKSPAKKEISIVLGILLK